MPTVLQQRLLLVITCSRKSYRGTLRVSGAVRTKNVALIYHHLRNEGYTAEQLSLETYYDFAKSKKSGMHWRPDVSVFAPAIGGRFNLYRQGDRQKLNDREKLLNLRALVEVKGSTATHKLGDAALCRTYQDDLRKFVQWKSLVADAKRDLEICGVDEPEYIFVGFDKRSKPLSGGSRSDLESFCDGHGIGFRYIYASE